MEDKRYHYFNSKNPPLLLQGFTQQAVNLVGQLESREQFRAEVNRGVITALDYEVFNISSLAANDESFWNDAIATLTSGGQELLRDVPLERFSYRLDLGNQAEQRVLTWINGGQVLNSVITANLTGGSTEFGVVAQLHAYYSTQELEAWRSKFNWPNGNGLKRRGYKLSHSNAANINQSITDTLPKNQGDIIGFSLLYLGISLFEALITLKIDGIDLLRNVNGTRFSRFNQRDPYVWKIPLLPGSTFELNVVNPNTTSNAGNLFIEFYFDN